MGQTLYANMEGFHRDSHILHMERATQDGERSTDEGFIGVSVRLRNSDVLANLNRSFLICPRRKEMMMKNCYLQGLTLPTSTSCMTSLVFLGAYLGKGEQILEPPLSSKPTKTTTPLEGDRVHVRQ